MSLFGTIGHGLSGLFGFGDDQAKADAAKKALQDAIASGGLQASAQFGQQGQALHDQADALQHGSNVGLDYSKVDADDGKLAAVRQHYLDQFQNGGLAGQAAVQAAQSARGLSTQGGLAGIRNETLNSAGSQAQVGQIAQGEMADAGSAENQLDAQKAAMALKKAVLQAQVTHQNFTKNLAAQQVDFDLTNTQQQLANQAQSTANQLAYQEGNTSLDYDQSQYELGKQLTQFLQSAASTGIAAGSGIAGAGAAAQPASGVTAATPAAILPSPSGAGAGYILPQATLGRTATPIFNTQPTLPNTSSFFTRT